jgi:hypothetical protein
MKTQSLNKSILVLFLASMLVILLAVPARAGGAQIWYLDQSNHQQSGKLMEKTRGGQSGSISVQSASVQYWLSDQASSADVTYARGAWVISLKTDGYWGSTASEKAQLVLGQWNAGNASFTGFSTSTQSMQTWGNGQNILRVEMQTQSVTVHQGNYLALQVTNLDTQNHIVVTDGSSYIESSTADPGYPLPELSTDLLLGSGLSGLLGYIYLNRKRAGDKTRSVKV